jgi:hypothetical protein
VEVHLQRSGCGQALERIPRNCVDRDLKRIPGQGL